MQNNPSCAVIIATHNGEQFLAEQIQSIKSQTNVNVDIFFSDDSSTDRSRDILLENGCKNLNSSTVQIGSSAQNFFHSIRKFEFQEKFDYILLADQDDIWLPNKISEAIHQLSINHAHCYSGSFYSWNMKRNTIKYINKSYVQNDIDFYFRSPGPGFTYCFTSSAFQKIQSSIRDHSKDIENVRWHDWFIYSLARSNGINWIIDSNAYSLYRLHGNNDTGQITSVSAIIFRLRFLISGQFTEQVRLAMCSENVEMRLKLAVVRMSLFDRLYLVSRLRHMRTKLADRIALLIWIIASKKK